MVADIVKIEPLSDDRIASSNKAKLFQKILRVQRSLEPTEKTGQNTFHKYSYSTAGDVLLPVSRACNEQGLIIMADCVETHTEPGRASVMVRLTVADSETGESISATAPGYAEDYSWKDGKPTGDKAVYKAITGATKYAVRSFFCLPSEDDPERSGTKTVTMSAIPNRKSAPSNTASSHKTAADNADLISQTTVELNRLGWSAAQGRLYLQETYNKATRAELTDTELRLFLQHLRSLS